MVAHDRIRFLEVVVHDGMRSLEMVVHGPLHRCFFLLTILGSMAHGRLKSAVVVNVRAGFLELIHPCCGQCNCDGQTASSCYTEVLCIIAPIFNVMSSAVPDVSLSRWNSVSPILAWLSFL